MNGKPRKISLSIYMAALFISAIIFISGIYVGKLIETSNLDSLSIGIDGANSKINSIEILYLLGEDSPSMCPVYRAELSSLDEKTEILGSKLSYLEEEKGVVDVELKRKYFLLEASAYLLSEKVRGTCGSNHTSILYFYSNKNCSDCGSQGKTLSSIKSKYGGDVRIYSFDGDLDTPIVDALMLKHSVSVYPSIVVGSDRTLPGLVGKDKIELLLN